MPEMDYTRVVRKTQRTALYVPDPMDRPPPDILATEYPSPSQEMHDEVLREFRRQRPLHVYDVVMVQGPRVV
ncbi:hypothetical protein DENSPDRAFT_844473, partial [Dentipellis sp. KUC8613]